MLYGEQEPTTNPTITLPLTDTGRGNPRYVQQQHPTHVTTPLPIEQGGTGATTAPQARQNLGALSVDRIGQPLGIVPLNANGKIPTQYLPPGDINSLSITGPLTVVIGGSIGYHVTDYDLDTTYTVTSSTGDIFQDPKAKPDIFFYLPNVLTSDNPNTGFTVNGVFYSIEVTPEVISTPVITSPIDNATLTVNTVLVTSSVFSSNNDQSSHKKTIWQISNTPDFTGMPEIESTYPLTEYSLSNLTSGQPVYIRVKYVAYSDIASAWSDPVHFTVMIFPSTQIVIMHRPNLVQVPDSGGMYGSTIALSPDGTVLAVTDPLVNVTPTVDAPLQRFGQIFIFKKINNLWVYQAAIDSGKSDSTFDIFGSSICISPNNQVIIVGSAAGRYATYKGSRSGLVQIYKTLIENDYTSLAISQVIEAAPYDWSDTNLGNTICLSADGTILAITSAGRADHPQRVLIHHYDGNSYVERDVITNPNPHALSKFSMYSNSISLSNDGTRLLINDPLNLDAGGSIYVYDYDGSVWNLTDTIIEPLGANPIDFGHPLVFSSNKNKFACGAQVQNLLSRGYVYIYELINSVWTRTHTVSHTDWNMNSLGGSAQSIQFTEADNVIIVGSPYQTALAIERPQYGAMHVDGAVYRIRLSTVDDTWVEEYKFTASDLNPVDAAYFGYPVLINSTDTEMIVGSSIKHWSANYNANGAVYIFR